MRFIKILTLIPCITFMESAQASSPSFKESTEVPIAKKSHPKAPPLSSLSNIFPMRTGFRTQEQEPLAPSKSTRILKKPLEKKDDKITAAAKQYNIDPVRLQQNYTKVVGWSHLSTLYDIRYQTGQTVADLFLISLPAILINEVFTKASFDFNGSPAAQEDLIQTATHYTRLGVKILGMDPNEIMNNLKLRMVSAYGVEMFSKQNRRDPKSLIEGLATQHPNYLASPNTLAWMLDDTVKMFSTMDAYHNSRDNDPDLEAQQAYKNLERQREVYNHILSKNSIFIEKISYLAEKLNLPPIQIVVELKMALANIPNLNEKEINILLFDLIDRVSCDDLLQEASRRFAQMAQISGIADEEIGLSLQKDLASMAFQTAAQATQKFERTSYLNCDDKERYPTSQSYLKTALSAEQMADFYLSQTQLYLWTASQVGAKEGKIYFLKKANAALFPTHTAIDKVFFETSQQEAAFKKKYNELRGKIVPALKNLDDIDHRPISDFSFGGSIAYNTRLF